jgi:hypothetical protein
MLTEGTDSHSGQRLLGPSMGRLGPCWYVPGPSQSQRPTPTDNTFRTASSQVSTRVGRIVADQALVARTSQVIRRELF